MLVYRIHKRDDIKVGPYYGSAIFTPEIIKRIPAKPSPEEDGIISFMSSFHFCGFSSIESLLSWFSAWVLRELFRRDYCVSILEVPDDLVKVGKNQVVFPLESCNYVKGIQCASKIQEMFMNGSAT